MTACQMELHWSQNMSITVSFIHHSFVIHTSERGRLSVQVTHVWLLISPLGRDLNVTQIENIKKKHKQNENS